MSKLFDLIGNEQRFCCWGPRPDEEIKTKDGKLVGDKAPISHNASFPIAWSKPQNWITQMQAREGMAKYGRKGIGMFTSNGDCPHLTAITALDLDHCVEGGAVVGDWQRALVEIAATHTRVSPSGTGLHLHFTGVDGFVAPEIASTTTDPATKLKTKRPYECYSKAHHIRIGPTVLHDVDLRPMTRELWDVIAPLLPGWLDEQQREAHAKPPAVVDHTTVEPKTPAGQLSAAQIAHVAKTYNAAHSVADELTRHGYVVIGNTVTRPGKDPRVGHSGDIRNGAYLSFSSNDPLKGKPGEFAHTAFSVFAHYDHGGDEQVAAWAAAAELGIELHVKGERAASATDKEGVDKSLASFSPDGAGNADAFVSRHGKEYAFCMALGWMRWTGKSWKRQDADAQLALDVTALLRERQAAGALTQNNAVVSASKPSMAHVAEVISFLTAQLRVAMDNFDRHPHLLNANNGVLDLRTGALSPHDPALFITHLVNSDYDPDADTSPIENFIAASIKGSRQVLKWMQMWFGYCLTGESYLEQVLYLHGEPRSGKGSLMEAMQHLLGADLCMSVDFATLAEKRNEGGQNFDLASLRGARMIVCDESPKADARKRIDSEKLKRMTGGSMINASFKHRDEFRYRPEFKVNIVSNFPISIDVDDSAGWGRFVAVEFPHSHLGREDVTVKAALKSEPCQAALLTWAAQGAQLMYSLGSAATKPPPELTASVAAQREQADTIGQWLEECCEKGEGCFTTNAAIQASYSQWCKTRDEKPRSSRAMTQTLHRRGFVMGRRFMGEKTSRGVDGLSILDG